MITKVKFLFLLVFFTLQCGSAIIFAQPEYFIFGKVINSGTLEPIPLATILLKNNQLKVFSNADGDFRILKNADILNDSIIITSIGYKQHSDALKNFNEYIENTIRLIPIVPDNGKVKLSGQDKRPGSIPIIERAVKKIPDNYPVKPFSYISYYRDYQKKDGEYINLNEAVVQSLDKGFANESIYNAYRLLGFRTNPDFREMNLSLYYTPGSQDSVIKSITNATMGDLSGNELFGLMRFDAIRNFNSGSFLFIDTLSKNFIHNHNFADPEIVYINNLPLYKIAFNGKTKVTGNSLVVKGAVYIEPKTYSIYKLVYSCSYQEKDVKPREIFSGDIEYGNKNPGDSLMYLKYISFSNFLKVTRTDADSYFRVVDAHWESQLYINPTMVIRFNKAIDPVSGAKMENYSVMLGKKPVKITSLQVRDKTLFIRTKDEYIGNNKDSCSFTIHNVKDIDGNIIDAQKKMDLYHVRELFVQDYNRPLHFHDSCLMDYKTLRQNCRSSSEDIKKYWMNTPVYINKSDK
jgi:hypothetical protein